MHLEATQLYGDKTWVEPSLRVSNAQKKALLAAAKQHCDAFGIDGLSCNIEKICGASLRPWGGNKGLVIRAGFVPFELQGTITLNQYGAACVVSVFKQCLGDDIFALNHSAEARRRAVIDVLQDVERIDFFFLVDHLIDQVAAFLLAAVQQCQQDEDADLG